MEQLIPVDSAVGRQARAFVRFYEALFEFNNGEETAMHDWLRRYNGGRIDAVIRYLETENA